MGLSRKNQQVLVGVLSIVLLLLIFTISSLYYLGRNSNSSSPTSIGRIEINNSFNTIKFHLRSDHFGVQEMMNHLSNLDLHNYEQQIKISEGIPSETYGKFLKGDKIVSASTYRIENGKIVIHIYLIDELSDEDLTFEITRNYFWSILALDEYLMLSGAHTPDYSKARETAFELSLKSSDQTNFPFIIIQ